MPSREGSEPVSEDFLLFTACIWALCGGAMVLAYVRSRDPFHPAVVVSAQLLFLYGVLPYRAVASGTTSGFLTAAQSAHVQWMNLLGVLCLTAGLVARTRREGGAGLPSLAEGTLPQRRALRGAKFFGLVGVGAFTYVTMTSGGFASVYGRGYGGGWHDSGYVRELFLLTVPGILWYLVATAGRPMRARDLFWIGLFSYPLALHGLLGGRRGPTLVVAFTLGMGYFMSRRKRPTLALVTAGGIALGLGVLLLVANRGEIYLGSSMEFKATPFAVFEAPETNEFIYGGAVILNAEYFDRYNWGGRYLAEIAIRPIPRAIWPSKYEDASEWLGLPSLEANAGTGVEGFESSIGWRGGVGAAPGIIADTWIEFWWGSMPFLFFIGWSFSYFWSRAQSRGGAWTIAFVIMMALSGYLVTQTFEAMIFRFLFMAVPTWILWRRVKSAEVVGQPGQAGLGAQPA